MATSFDYIFLGAGCATLSIVTRMIDSGKFSDKKILIIDKAPKTQNDRTWCFWEKQTGYFNHLVYKQWNQLLFKLPNGTIPLEISPYTYKMIRGIDFYKYCFAKMEAAENIHLRYGDIQLPSADSPLLLNGTPLDTSGALVFNSIYQPTPPTTSDIHLLQHFKGWIIETAANTFDDKVGTLMDFSVDQQHGTTFIYVLPLSDRRALVEYTLFTATLLQDDAYDESLRHYIQTFLHISDYQVVESEFGIIPMTNAAFPKVNNGMFYIGTAGGQTKASTGYTFQFIQKAAGTLVASLVKGDSPSLPSATSGRFRFYDNTLLHILAHNKVPGQAVFTRLFERNKAANVFRFLDNETNLIDELALIKSLPVREFSIAGLKEFVNLLR